jgi:DNA-binding IclR family transcriptional regulator
MPIELLALLTSADVRLSIVELAEKLDISHRQALLMLVTLECHGMLRWDEEDRLYVPDSNMLTLLFHAMSSSVGQQRSQSEAALVDTGRSSQKRPKRTRSLNSRMPFDTINNVSQRSMA